MGTAKQIMDVRHEAEKFEPQADKHNLTFRFALFKEQDDEAKTMKWLDIGYDYSYGVPPGTQEEEEDALPGAGGKSRRPSSHAGTGAGKGGTNTTVVVTNQGAPCTKAEVVAAVHGPMLAKMRQWHLPQATRLSWLSRTTKAARCTLRKSLYSRRTNAFSECTVYV